MINLVHYDIPVEAIIGGAVGLVVLIIIVVVVIAKLAGGKKGETAKQGAGTDAAPVGGKAGGGNADKDTAAWQIYAKENSLVLSGTHPALQLEGGSHGYNVRFWQVQAESEEYDDEGDPIPGKVTSQAAVSIPVPVGDLSLAREGYFAKTGRTYSGQDIQVYDPQFDTAFIVRHSNPDKCRKILNTKTKSALVAAQQRYPDIEVSDQMVRLHGAGTTDISQVDRILQALIGVAAAFEKNT